MQTLYGFFNYYFYALISQKRLCSREGGPSDFEEKLQACREYVIITRVKIDSVAQSRDISIYLSL